MCNLSTMRAKLACLGQPLPCVWSHVGWLVYAMWPPGWKQGLKNKVRVGGRWGRMACSDCTAVLVFVTRRRAAVESGPELSRGGGSRELLPRGQQWAGASSGQILLLLLYLFHLFLQLTSLLLLFFSPGNSLLSPRCGQRRWWLAGFGEMRAAAAP